jgi:hypothetical protein
MRLHTSAGSVIVFGVSFPVVLFHNSPVDRIVFCRNGDVVRLLSSPLVLIHIVCSPQSINRS